MENIKVIINDKLTVPAAYNKALNQIELKPAIHKMQKAVAESLLIHELVHYIQFNYFDGQPIWPDKLPKAIKVLDVKWQREYEAYKLQLLHLLQKYSKEKVREFFLKASQKWLYEETDKVVLRQALVDELF